MLQPASASPIERWNTYFTQQGKEPLQTLTDRMQAAGRTLKELAAGWDVVLLEPTQSLTRYGFAEMTSSRLGKVSAIGIRWIAPNPAEERAAPFRRRHDELGLKNLLITLVEITSLLHALDGYCAEVEQSWKSSFHYDHRMEVQFQRWRGLYEVMRVAEQEFSSWFDGEECRSWTEQVACLMQELAVCEKPSSTPDPYWRGREDERRIPVLNTKKALRDSSEWDHEYSASEIQHALLDMNERARLRARCKRAMLPLLTAISYGDVPPFHAWFEFALRALRGQAAPPIDPTLFETFQTLKKRLLDGRRHDDPVIEVLIQEASRLTGERQPSFPMWAWEASMTTTLLQGMPAGPYTKPVFPIPAEAGWPEIWAGEIIEQGQLGGGVPYAIHRLDEPSISLPGSAEKANGLIVMHGGKSIRLMACHRMLHSSETQPTLGFKGIHEDGRCVVHPAGVIIMPLLMTPFVEAVKSLAGEEDLQIRRRESLERWMRACLRNNRMPQFNPEQWVFVGPRLARLVPDQERDYSPEGIQPLLQLLAKHWPLQMYQTFIDQVGLRSRKESLALNVAAARGMAAFSHQADDERPWGRALLDRRLEDEATTSATTEWMQKVGPSYAQDHFRPCVDSCFSRIAALYHLGRQEVPGDDELQAVRTRVADLLLREVGRMGPIIPIPASVISEVVICHARDERPSLRDPMAVAIRLWREACGQQSISRAWLNRRLEREGCCALAQRESIFRLFKELQEAKQRVAPADDWTCQLEPLSRGAGELPGLIRMFDALESGLGAQLARRIQEVWGLSPL
ncbi:MAG: hypothetical protein ACOYKZ_02385 [Chlamydiia bacterium]